MGLWTLSYNGFNPKEESLREALCTLGNGYYCTRRASAQSEKVSALAGTATRVVLQ